MKQFARQLTALALAFFLLAGVIALPARADGTLIVGEVTVTATTSINIRSGGSVEYPIIGVAYKGELFQTTGQVASGWFEILLQDGRFGYVSNKLVYFYQYPNPIPMGQQFTIPVYYMNTTGQTLKTVSVPVKTGQNIITADDSQVPGYRLVSTRSIYVTVDSLGNAQPSGVVFRYETGYVQPSNPPAVTLSLPVYYRDIYNNLIASETRVVSQGTQLVRADASKLPQGYYLSGSTDAVVTVTSYGTAAPSSVTFVVTAMAAQTQTPAYFSVPVSYRDELGNVLYNTSQTVTPGYTTVSANDSMVPSGYSLTSSRSIVVYCSSQGVTFPSTVTFTYRRAVSASVQIVYRDTQNRTLYTETRQFNQGSFTITADSTRVPSGYVLQGSPSVQITVYANGTVSQSQVVFTYAQPLSAQLAIQYRDNNGASLYTETQTLAQGSYTITANDARVPTGYVLQSARSVQVTVYANGTVSVGQVVFTYAPPAPPVTINVPVIYKDYGGAVLHQTTVSVSSSAPQQVTADMSLAPAGFILSGPSAITVTVSPAGTSTPAEVVFVFRDPATITEAQMLPAYQTFSFSGAAEAVFSGPGEQYYRANDGRASVQGGRLRVWGTVGDWALIGYGLSNNLYRIGYIRRTALPASLSVPELYLGSQAVTTVNNAPLNDDPIINPIKIMEIPAGTGITLLAYLDERWAYVETMYNNQPIRGFVRRHNISQP